MILALRASASALGRACLVGLTLVAGSLGAEAQAAKPIPEAPYYYVLDEPKILDERTRAAVSSLLVEHDHATGEQIVVAIFDSLDSEDLVGWTNQVFSQWKIGKRGKDNGVLLALFWKDHQARIEVGYGLESLLTDAKSKLVIEEALIPELKRGNPDQAIRLAALEILRVIESPLIQSGQAEQILKSAGPARRQRQATSRPIPAGWVTWIILGLILVSIVLNTLTSADAHFTRDGWYRPRPWQPGAPRRRSWTGFGGGGFGGGGGGFGGGGFSGGGGSSGGGGASGQW